MDGPSVTVNGEGKMQEVAQVMASVVAVGLAATTLACMEVRGRVLVVPGLKRERVVVEAEVKGRVRVRRVTRWVITVGILDDGWWRGSPK